MPSLGVAALVPLGAALPRSYQEAKGSLRLPGTYGEQGRRTAR